MTLKSLVDFSGNIWPGIWTKDSSQSCQNLNIFSVPFSTSLPRTSQFHQSKNKEHNFVTWFLIPDPWTQVEPRKDCERPPCAEPASVYRLLREVRLTHAALLEPLSTSLPRGKSGKGFAKTKHQRKAMGKGFCFCVSSCCSWGSWFSNRWRCGCFRQGLPLPSCSNLGNWRPASRLSKSRRKAAPGPSDAGGAIAALDWQLSGVTTINCYLI